MRNEIIESYIKFLNLKCEYTKEYIMEDVCELTDKNGNLMQILNFFDYILVTVNGEQIGSFKRLYSKIWITI